MPYARKVETGYFNNSQDRMDCFRKIQQMTFQEAEVFVPTCHGAVDRSKSFPDSWVMMYCGNDGSGHWELTTRDLMPWCMFPSPPKSIKSSDSGQKTDTSTVSYVLLAILLLLIVCVVYCITNY